MKKSINVRKFAFIVAMMLGTSSLVFAHSGGTNAQGCHRNHKTGDYHCH